MAGDGRGGRAKEDLAAPIAEFSEDGFMTETAKIAHRIKTDKDLKKQCVEFFELALSKIWDRQTTLRQKGLPFIRHNVIFHADEDLFLAQSISERFASRGLDQSSATRTMSTG